MVALVMAGAVVVRVALEAKAVDEEMEAAAAADSVAQAGLEECLEDRTEDSSTRSRPHLGRVRSRPSPTRDLRISLERSGQLAT